MKCRGSFATLSFDAGTMGAPVVHPHYSFGEGALLGFALQAGQTFEDKGQRINVAAADEFADLTGAIPSRVLGPSRHRRTVSSTIVAFFFEFEAIHEPRDRDLRAGKKTGRARRVARAFKVVDLCIDDPPIFELERNFTSGAHYRLVSTRLRPARLGRPAVLRGLHAIDATVPSQAVGVSFSF